MILNTEWSKYKNGITKQQAEDLLHSDLVDFESCINKEVKKQQLSQNEYDSLVILCFNIGITQFKQSSVLKMLNGLKGNYPTLELAWKAFNKDNGKVSNGLTNRRASEWNIFSKNVYKRI